MVSLGFRFIFEAESFDFGGVEFGFLLLRFEPNLNLLGALLQERFFFFLTHLKAAQTHEITECLIEGAVMSVVVSDENVELAVILHAVHALLDFFFLQAARANAEPAVGDHAFDQVEFGGGDGLPFGHEGSEAAIVFSLVFAGEDFEIAVGMHGGEAVGGVVAGGDGFAFGGFWAAGELGVGAVGGELGGGRGAECGHGELLFYGHKRAGRDCR